LLRKISYNEIMATEVNVGSQLDALLETRAARDDALNARDLAKRWASEGKGVEVQNGKYSALHHRLKSEAAQSAAESAQGAAETAQSAAENAEISATDSKNDAQTAQNAAETAESNAQASASDAEKQAQETASFTLGDRVRRATRRMPNLQRTMRKVHNPQQKQPAMMRSPPRAERRPPKLMRRMPKTLRRPLRVMLRLPLRMRLVLKRMLPILLRTRKITLKQPLPSPIPMEEITRRGRRATPMTLKRLHPMRRPRRRMRAMRCEKRPRETAPPSPPKTNDFAQQSCDSMSASRHSKTHNRPTRSLRLWLPYRRSSTPTFRAHRGYFDRDTMPRSRRI